MDTYEKHLTDLLEWKANDATGATQPEEDRGLTDSFVGELSGSHSNSGTGSGSGTSGMADATDDVEHRRHLTITLLWPHSGTRMLTGTWPPIW